MLAVLRVKDEPVPVTVVSCTRQAMLSYWPGLSTVKVALVGPPLLARYRVGPVMEGAASDNWANVIVRAAVPDPVA